MKVGLRPISVKILLLYNTEVMEAFIADFMMNSYNSWPMYANIWLSLHITPSLGNWVDNYNNLIFIRLFRLIVFQKCLTISFENLLNAFPLILMRMKLYIFNIQQASTRSSISLLKIRAFFFSKLFRIWNLFP